MWRPHHSCPPPPVPSPSSILKVIDDEICFERERWKSVHEIFSARSWMHHEVYTHKTVSPQEPLSLPPCMPLLPPGVCCLGLSNPDPAMTVCAARQVKAVEYMVVDALVEANSTMRIAEHRLDPAKYTYLDDTILRHIEQRYHLQGDSGVLPRPPTHPHMVGAFASMRWPGRHAHAS